MLIIYISIQLTCFLLFIYQLLSYILDLVCVLIGRPLSANLFHASALSDAGGLCLNC